MKTQLYFSLLILCTFICTTPGFSQKKSTFSWEEENCSCIGTYSTKQYPGNELQNTVDHILSSGLLTTNVTAFRLEELSKISMDTLTAECLRRLHPLYNARFVQTHYWDSLRNERIQEIEKQCELSTITILGYQNPDTLRSYATATDLCKEDIDALAAGGKKMLEAWNLLIIRQMNSNADPGWVYKEYQARLHSPDSLQYARMQLMTFSWWNCANQTIPYVQDEYQAYMEFRKLFRRVKCKCIDP